MPSEPRRYAQPPRGGLGSSDAVPPGFRPPGYGSLQEPFPGGMGRSGGMHVGPDDPLFAGRSGMQRPGRPGMNPPGARFDPIGPPGMPVSLLKLQIVGISAARSVMQCMMQPKAQLASPFS